MSAYLRLNHGERQFLPPVEERTDSKTSLRNTRGKGVAVRSILREILLFSCMAIFITGIVVALASLLI